MRCIPPLTLRRRWGRYVMNKFDVPPSVPPDGVGSTRALKGDAHTTPRHSRGGTDTNVRTGKPANPKPERYIVTFEAKVDIGRPAIIRLRALLKLALRGFGMRCVELRSEHGTEIETGIRDGHAAAEDAAGSVQ